VCVCVCVCVCVGVCVCIYLCLYDVRVTCVWYDMIGYDEMQAHLCTTEMAFSSTNGSGRVDLIEESIEALSLSPLSFA